MISPAIPLRQKNMPILGYRTWRLSHQGLQAISRTHIWAPRQALHYSHFGLSPCKGFQECDCGFYAFHSPNLPSLFASIHYPNHDHLLPPYFSCSGATINWGKVVVGENGIRSTDAKVVALLDIGNSLWNCEAEVYRSPRARFDPDFLPELFKKRQTQLEVIANRYEIPLLTKAKLEIYAREFGSPAQDELTN
jgi:hypothetical protein